MAAGPMAKNEPLFLSGGLETGFIKLEGQGLLK
jgi:hypothetical protein